MAVSRSAEKDASLSGANEDLSGLFYKRDHENGDHEFFFSEIKHAQRTLERLNGQRSERVLCDVTLCVGTKRIQCHRNVLASCSPYFMAMFTGEMRESHEQNIVIEGIDPSIMQQLVDYAYTADIVINADNAQCLLAAANMVQFQAVEEACCKFLGSEMDASNCLGIHCFAEAHVCMPLCAQAKIFALKHFSDVTNHEEILQLSSPKLIEFLKSEDLTVPSEDCVLHTVIEWLKYDHENRCVNFADVLSNVRLPLVNPYYFYDVLETQPFISSLPGCQPLLDEAKKYFVLKDRHNELQSSRTTPRPSIKLPKLLITVGGEIYSKNYLSSVDAYDLTKGSWLRMRELPEPRCHHGCVVSDACVIYITGGFNKDKVVLNSVLRFEPNVDKWVKVASMISCRARHGMASLDGFLFAIGGHDGQGRTNSCEKYSWTTNKWCQIASLPMPLSRCQAASMAGYLYVAGGTTELNNQCVDIFQRYSPRTDCWEILRPMPFARCLGGLVSIKGCIYAVGGSDANVQASGSLFCYYIENNRWIELASMNDARFDAGVIALDEKIYVLSGHDGENSFYHTIEEYDVLTDKWSPFTSTILPYGRCRFGCVAISNLPKAL